MEKSFLTIPSEKRAKHKLCILATILLIALAELNVAREVTKIKPQCGQFCVFFCCKLLGVPLEMENILELIPPKEKGESMLEIKKLLERIGLEVKGQFINANDLLSGPYPMIAHMKNHFVVVESADRKIVRILDGYGRRRIVPMSTFQQTWDQKVLVVQRPETERPFPAFLPIGHKEPCLQFKTLFVDAGDIPDGKKTVSFEFPFQNLGEGDLDIRKVKTTCKCTVAETPQQPIPPGQKGKIVLSYDVGNKRGPFSYEAYVQSNDPRFPVIALQIGGNCVRKLFIKPAKLDFSKIVKGVTAIRRCFIRYTGDEFLELSPVTSGVEGIKVFAHKITKDNIRELYTEASGKIWLDDRNLWMIEIRIEPKKDFSPKLEQSIKLVTNLSGYPEIAIPIDISFVSPIEARPSFLFLAEGWQSKEIDKEIKLSSRIDANFRIDSIDVKGTGLTCKYNRASTQDTKIGFQGKVDNENRLASKTIGVNITMPDSDETFQITIPIYAFPKKESM